MTVVVEAVATAGLASFARLVSAMPLKMLVSVLRGRAVVKGPPSIGVRAVQSRVSNVRIQDVAGIAAMSTTTATNREQTHRETIPRIALGMSAFPTVRTSSAATMAAAEAAERVALERPARRVSASVGAAAAT